MSYMFSLLTLPEVEQAIRGLEEIRLTGAGTVSFQGQSVTYASSGQIKSDLRILYERREILMGGRPKPRIRKVRIQRLSGF